MTELISQPYEMEAIESIIHAHLTGICVGLQDSFGKVSGKISIA